MEGEKFNLGEKNQVIRFMRKVQICIVGSVAKSVGTPFEFAVFAAVSTSNIAELVLFVFSVHNDGFCGGPNTFCQEKHQHFHVDRQLVTKKEISSKINIR